MTEDLSTKEQRIEAELKAVGVKLIGRWIRPGRKLSHVLRDDEHILAAVYGLSAEGTAMLVATDQRIIYVESNVAYYSSDEFGYDTVIGINQHASVLYESLTLFTRIHEYRLTFVNTDCAHRFEQAVEARAVKSANATPDDITPTADMVDDDFQLQPAALNSEVRAFLASHETVVVSTASRTGQVHSAVMYYVARNDSLYVLTKKDTRKSHNMMRGGAVSLVVYDAETMETAQIQGVAKPEQDPAVRQEIFQLVSQKPAGGIDKLPIAQLDAGGYIVFHIRPTDVMYRNYGASH